MGELDCADRVVTFPDFKETFFRHDRFELPIGMPIIKDANHRVGKCSPSQTFA